MALNASFKKLKSRLGVDDDMTRELMARLGPDDVMAPVALETSRYPIMNMPSIVRSTPFIAPALLVMIVFFNGFLCWRAQHVNDAEPYEKETIAQLLGLANYLESNGDRATAAAVLPANR